MKLDSLKCAYGVYRSIGKLNIFKKRSLKRYIDILESEIKEINFFDLVAAFTNYMGCAIENNNYHTLDFSINEYGIIFQVEDETIVTCTIKSNRAILESVNATLTIYKNTPTTKSVNDIWFPVRDKIYDIILYNISCLLPAKDVTPLLKERVNSNMINVLEGI